jgi:uncharacterized protein with HEPN domain
MRNFLAHAYFDVNLDILWKTAVEDVPALAAALRRARDTPGDSES